MSGERLEPGHYWVRRGDVREHVFVYDVPSRERMVRSTTWGPCKLVDLAIDIAWELPGPDALAGMLRDAIEDVLTGVDPRDVLQEAIRVLDAVVGTTPVKESPPAAGEG